MSTNFSSDSRIGSAFGERLTIAFQTAKPAEIARKLGISYQGARNYLDGRMPSIEKLVEISVSTGYSIHWLLTGEGPERLSSSQADQPQPAKRKDKQELLAELERASDVSGRLRLLFNGKTIVEVSELLGISEADAQRYFDGRLPPNEVLMRIVNRTGVSLNWLLTNKGPQWAAPAAYRGGDTVSEENGSSLQPRKEAVSPELKEAANEERMVLAYLRLLVEQNAVVIQLLREIVQRGG